MSAVRNTMQLICEADGRIDARYDMHQSNAKEIRAASSGALDMIYNGFKFGYMQGMKAAKAAAQKGGAVHG